LVDAEFVDLLENFKKEKPSVPLIIDTDTELTDSINGGAFDRAILEGLTYDEELGNRGWAGLTTQVEDEDGVISLAYTSGTTARPKGVEYTHRGLYLAALANVIESGLNIELSGARAKYLWTLPMFHVRTKNIFSSSISNSHRLMDGPFPGVSQPYAECITVYARLTTLRYGGY
jgi:long-subunit acyl-CoA synthetase (AMP-forming)